MSLLLKALNYKINFNFNKLIMILFITIFGLLSGLRAPSVGTDTENYARIFLSIGNHGLDFSILNSKYPIYWLYNYILYHISDNVQVLIFINAIMITSIMGYSMYRLASDFFLSSLLYITLYFYFNSMNLSRQFISMGLIVLAVTFLFKKKTKSFWILFLVAVLVHNIAIVSFPLYFLFKTRWNNIKIGLFLLFTMVISVSYNQIINLFIKVFPQYNLYTQNIEGIETLSSQSNGRLMYVYILYLVLAIIGFVYIVYTNYKIDKEFIFFEICVLFSSSMGLLLAQDILINRVLMYYLIFTVFFIPLIIEKISDTLFQSRINTFLSRILLKNGMFFITLIPMTVQLMGNISNVNPYIFFGG